VLLSNLEVGIENNINLTISTRGHKEIPSDFSSILDPSSSRSTILTILAGKIFQLHRTTLQ